MNERPRWIHSLGARLRDYVPIGRLSYAQEGEDLVLARIFESIPRNRGAAGFFVDIGAHHPTRFSNTYYFYRRGWCGLNVDARPGTVSLFRRMRPKDITVERGIGAHAGLMTYFVFNEPALNTFSERDAHKNNRPPYKIVNTLQIRVDTLARVLDEYLPLGISVDFMTIDVEGFDHEIVSSNDWERTSRTW